MESRERVVCMVLGSRGEGKVTVWRAESIELKRDVEELRRVEVILGVAAESILVTFAAVSSRRVADCLCMSHF